MHARIWMSGIKTMAAPVFALALCLTGCGRGPVEHIGSPLIASVTIELFVQGQITPSQGDYIIALNTNFDPVTNINSASTTGSEQPGQPTVLEAYGANPAPFTHWDQAFVYGSNPQGLPNCPIPPTNSFSYCYKAVTTNGGQNTFRFVPIILSPNTFTFIPNGNSGTGSGNALILTLPFNCFNNGGTQALGSCGPGFTFTSDVTQLYVNLVTLDNTGAPQDQLACLAGNVFTIDLTVTTTTTTPLTKSTQCGAPSNTNLVITGGIAIVNVPPGG